MRRMMKVLAAAFMIAFAHSAIAQESVVEMVTKACDKEIKQYCSQVKMGQGRMLSCFYAHEDKLTVKWINLARKNPIAFGLITEIYVHCKDSYEQMTLDEAATNPSGSGPYRLASWTRGSEVVLEKV